MVSIRGPVSHPPDNIVRFSGGNVDGRRHILLNKIANRMSELGHVAPTIPHFAGRGGGSDDHEPFDPLRILNSWDTFHYLFLHSK